MSMVQSKSYNQNRLLLLPIQLRFNNPINDYLIRITYDTRATDNDCLNVSLRWTDSVGSVGMSLIDRAAASHGRDCALGCLLSRWTWWMWLWDKQTAGGGGGAVALGTWRRPEKKSKNTSHLGRIVQHNLSTTLLNSFHFDSRYRCLM